MTDTHERVIDPEDGRIWVVGEPDWNGDERWDHLSCLVTGDWTYISPEELATYERV